MTEKRNKAAVHYLAALRVIAPYPAPADYAFALILFFGRGRGRGGRATAKPTVSPRSSADGFAVKMKRTKAGGRIVKSCSPFSAAKWQRQKSRQSRGQSGDFLRSKKYYSSLDGLDSRNGVERGLFSVGRCAILEPINQPANRDL